jgi:predicted MFS family arabinose efflux permease
VDIPTATPSRPPIMMGVSEASVLTVPAGTILGRFQHFTFPFDRRAHVPPMPSAIAVTPVSPSTAVGRTLAPPQHSTVPVERRAQVSWSPAAIAVTPDNPETVIGPTRTLLLLVVPLPI